MGTWKVSKEHSGLSLQTFLKEQLGAGISSKHIKRSIDAGKCLLNGQAERFGSRPVGTGDKVEFHALTPTFEETVDSANILYVDESVIAYNKPPGVLSDSISLADALKKQFGDVILLHRLDKETSGILLFARTPSAAEAIETLFKKRLVHKTYLAIIDGIPAQVGGVIDNYLGKVATFQGQTLWGEVPKERGLHAKTSWHIEKKGTEAALVVCHPETGRTHQIRVHLSGMGHAILGDHQYGRTFRCRYQAPRILLHAAEVVFDHPLNKKQLKISAPLPEDFQQTIKLLIGEDGKHTHR